MAIPIGKWNDLGICWRLHFLATFFYNLMHHLAIDQVRLLNGYTLVNVRRGKKHSLSLKKKIESQFVENVDFALSLVKIPTPFTERHPFTDPNPFYTFTFLLYSENDCSSAHIQKQTIQVSCRFAYERRKALLRRVHKSREYFPPFSSISFGWIWAAVNQNGRQKKRPDLAPVDRVSALLSPPLTFDTSWP